MKPIALNLTSRILQRTTFFTIHLLIKHVKTNVNTLRTAVKYFYKLYFKTGLRVGRIFGFVPDQRTRQFEFQGPDRDRDP